MAKKNDPAAYLRRVMTEKDLTYRDVSERAKRKDHVLAVSYIMNLATGRLDNPTVKTLKALAAGLGRPESEVFSAFGVEPPAAKTRVLVVPTSTPEKAKRPIGFVSSKKPRKT